jgi:hypothetical protein
MTSGYTLVNRNFPFEVVFSNTWDGMCSVNALTNLYILSSIVIVSVISFLSLNRTSWK